MVASAVRHGWPVRGLAVAPDCWVPPMPPSLRGPRRYGGMKRTPPADAGLMRFVPNDGAPSARQSHECRAHALGPTQAISGRQLAGHCLSVQGRVPLSTALPRERRAGAAAGVWATPIRRFASPREGVDG
jgi:hypothetical protein